MRNPINSIPQIYRHLKRWRQILAVLSKYGLADWLSRLNIEFVKNQLKAPDGEILARQTRESRIRLALTELGPTFIKIGQLLSTRPDVVGPQLADELTQLQSNVRIDRFEDIKATVEAELGQPLDELFSDFEEEPIASASIAQVHRARLATGERVVLKVQHKGIEQTVYNDTELLTGIAQLLEKFEDYEPYRPRALVAELSRSLRRELDFGREERNLQQFAAQFAGNSSVRIPKPHTDLCTPRVLTMDFIDGLKLADTKRLSAEGIDLVETARRGTALYLDMIFNHGFYHADPHPGNILLLPGNVIGLLDFGMVGRISERLREDIEEMLLAIVNHDVPLLTSILRRVGSVPFDLDEGQLANDVADFVGHYATQSFADFNLGESLSELNAMIRRHRITLPAEAALLIKVLATLEGTAKLLSPDFSVMKMMRPFQRKILLRRLSPRRQLKKIRRLAFDLQQMAEEMPQRLLNIMEQIQSGKFDLHVEHRRLGPSVNRLVLGLMTSALFLGSAIMLSANVPPLLFPDNTYLGGLHKVSILGLAGSCLSMLTGFRLVLAIRKSGNLDRKD